MKTLFVDSSRKSLSIALAKDDKLLFVSNVESYSRHSNYLMNEIQNILNKFNLIPNDLDNFIVLNGPGSFTGVRVGVTICKTMSWVLSKKIYQLNNLEALSVGIKDELVITIIPDKKDYSYVGMFGDKKVMDYLNINDDILNINNKSITIVCIQENEFLYDLKEKLDFNNKVKIKIIDDYDYMNVINYTLSKVDINPHLAEPIYLKKIDAEKKKNVN